MRRNSTSGALFTRSTQSSPPSCLPSPTQCLQLYIPRSPVVTIALGRPNVPYYSYILSVENFHIPNLIKDSMYINSMISGAAVFVANILSGYIIKVIGKKNILIFGHGSFSPIHAKLDVFGSPLYKLIKMKTAFLWSSDADQALQTLRRALVEALIEISTCKKSASSKLTGLGSMLAQETEGEILLGACASRTLHRHELNYPTKGCLIGGLSSLGLQWTQTTESVLVAFTIFNAVMIIPFLAVKCLIVDHFPTSLSITKEDVLPYLIDDYNRGAKQSIIKMMFADVSKFNVTQVRGNIYGSRHPKQHSKQRLKVSDTVHVRKSKIMFEKGYKCSLNNLFKSPALCRDSPYCIDYLSLMARRWNERLTIPSCSTYYFLHIQSR
uniref:Uncharacterized protein n=1 Tax=Timema poppense TaxID=170557 RepID=A0A7R9H0T2_TIMPO|nr:unnamed protein product [Timema poppensis]